MSEWQPIETAPRDGAPVDLWNHDYRLTDMVWMVTSPRHPNGMWKREWQDWCDVQTINPTHWMPLPEPPK